MACATVSNLAYVLLLHNKRIVSASSYNKSYNRRVRIISSSSSPENNQKSEPKRKRPSTSSKDTLKTKERVVEKFSTPIIFESENDLDLFQSSMATGFRECILTEIIIGIWNTYGSVFAANTVSSNSALRGVLLDLSMSMSTAIQDYLTFKKRQNWICNETSCDLLDNGNSVSSPSTLSSSKHCTNIKPGNNQQPVFEATVQYLVVLDKELTSKSNDFVTTTDNNSLFIPTPSTNGNDKPFSSTNTLLEGDPSIEISSSPSTQPTSSSSAVSLQCIAKSCMISLLVNLLTHQILPQLFHLIEQSVFAQTFFIK
eukprot:gene29979-39156_t